MKRVKKALQPGDKVFVGIDLHKMFESAIYLYTGYKRKFAQ